MRIVITKTFLYAHGGWDVRQYAPGSVIDSDDEDFIGSAIAMGCTDASQKDAGDAPMNKDAGAAPKNKRATKG